MEKRHKIKSVKTLEQKYVETNAKLDTALLAEISGGIIMAGAAAIALANNIQVASNLNVLLGVYGGLGMGSYGAISSLVYSIKKNKAENELTNAYNENETSENERIITNGRSR